MAFPNGRRNRNYGLFNSESPEEKGVDDMNFSRLLEMKFQVAQLIGLIFLGGVFYQRTEANTALVQNAYRTFVRQDVQAEKEERYKEKLELILRELQEMRSELRQRRNN